MEKIPTLSSINKTVNCKYNMYKYTNKISFI